jgi:glycerophosphoryl diester phosphodiesterase
MIRHLFAAAALLALAAPARGAGGPLIVAHRGGTGDAPENTTVAIGRALENGVGAIWLTVQMSRDGVPVLYRPKDLSALSDRSGPVSSMTAAELGAVNVGYAFKARDGSTPFRAAPATVPTLEAALAMIPAGMPLFLDVKSPDADPAAIASAMRTALDAAGLASRTTVYSTDKRYTDAARAAGLAVFQAREATRTDLARVLLDRHCPAMQPEGWAGYELRRDVTVTEDVTLGAASSKAVMEWDPDAVACFRAGGIAKLMMIGVNSRADYDEAKALGADAVLVDSPALFKDVAGR